MIPLAGTALANEGYDKANKSGAGFDTLDTNRDGRISRAEAEAAAAAERREWATRGTGAG